jgi:hypothetical protein
MATAAGVTPRGRRQTRPELSCDDQDVDAEITRVFIASCRKLWRLTPDVRGTICDVLLRHAFTPINTYLFKPVDLPDPRALHALSWSTGSTMREQMQRQLFSPSDYDVLRADAARFAELAAVRNVRVVQDTVATGGLLVTGNYFAMLGARPALGRLLTPADAAARGGEAVVVLSYRAWRARYGADPSIIGQRSRWGGSASRWSAWRSRTRF